MESLREREKDELQREVTVEVWGKGSERRGKLIGRRNEDDSVVNGKMMERDGKARARMIIDLRPRVAVNGKGSSSSGCKYSAVLAKDVQCNSNRIALVNLGG